MRLDFSAKIKKINIFRFCQKDIDKILERSKFNEAQRTAILTFRHIRNRFSLVTGPPGTGKTELLIFTVKTLIGPVKPGHTKQRVLVVAPNNVPVDEAATRLFDEAMKDEATRAKVVIRCHSFDTEKGHVLAMTANAEERDSSLDPVDQGPAEEMDRLSITYSMYLTYRNATARPFGVADRRFQCETLSLSAWMLRKAGIIPGHPIADPDSYDSFISLFEQSQRERLDEETKKSFTDEYNKLRDATIQDADVIFTTLMNASDQNAWMNFKPDVIIVDECARATEAQFWCILGNYRIAPNILIANDQQLKPMEYHGRERLYLATCTFLLCKAQRDWFTVVNPDHTTPNHRGFGQVHQ